KRQLLSDVSLDDLLPLEQINPYTLDSLISAWGNSDNLGKFEIDRSKLSVHMNKFNLNDNLNLDSSNFENFEFEFDFSNFDSSLNKIMIFQSEPLRFNSSNIQIDLNNLDSIINKKIEQKIVIKRQNNESNIDSLGESKMDKIHRMMPKDKFSHLDNRLKMMTELTVNKLIPVRFDVPDGGADLIFWFEPTDELLEVVPDNIKSQVAAEIEAINSSEDICKAAPETGSETIMDVWRSCSGAVENMMVYPNPTNGPVSVNFQLKEDRKVKLSIHDLTGKLLMTLSPETLIRKGEFRENFNLNKLTPGMYLLVAQTHYGEQTLQRIVIE
ncbi:MAG: T9SS type A sorting domain-containing protein, partial [Candidatus Kapabacteria bacterium]|nr:T9SS type A sorting domain-containing protein [Candidatus Kapabacteria bacterium]